MTTNEEGGLRRVALEDFANHPHSGTLPVQRGREITNESKRNVLNRVLADAVNSRHAHPPERVLNFVTRDFRLVLIHVRHIVVEPAIKRVPNFGLIAMW